jgi:quinoprotein glucose dehydrogenase
MIRRAFVKGAAAAVIGGALLGPVFAAAGRDWPVYFGDAAGSHYSGLGQIDRANVSQLAPAWTYRSGDAAANTQIQCNPLIIDGVLYGSTPQLKLVALDAATGRELWRFDPFASGEVTGGRGVNRGMAVWREGGERRIFFTAGHYLHSVDPATGRLVTSFGEGGRVDLLQGLDRDVRGLYVVGTSPGAIFRDLIIVSTRVGEGPGPAAPGHIRAYDVRTGQRRWIFHTIPFPGEYGHGTWPTEAWTKTGGANCWAGLVIDHERGLAFVPTGSAAYDFWGGHRQGQNLFADCLLALDAATGERKWHFQFTHHDLWDRDPPAPPVLCEVTREGRKIAAVVQITKTGHVWAFDRDTGESLFPWKEMPAPASTLRGEVAWPTQPVPLAPEPFVRQKFTEDELTNLSPAAHESVRRRLQAAVPHRPFTPPDTREIIILPGFDGGGEWGGAAVDPDGVLYVNGTEMPWLHQMIPVDPAAMKNGAGIYAQLCVACHGPERQGNPAQNIPGLVGIGAKAKAGDLVTLFKTGRGMMPSFDFLPAEQKVALADYLLGGAATAKPVESNSARSKQEPTGGPADPGIPYTSTGYNRFLDPEGYPALRPPWGTLNAIDLNTGRYLWRRPLGEFPELTARGVPLTGTENYGGPLVTAGGLVFIAATKDGKFRAFDQATGAQLWEASLPAGGYATPATYSAGGRQYVVIACGGGKMGTPSGDSYVAFALP